MNEISSSFGQGKAPDTAQSYDERRFHVVKEAYEAFGEGPETFGLFKKLFQSPPLNALKLHETLARIEATLGDHDAVAQSMIKKREDEFHRLMSGLSKPDYNAAFKSGVERGGNLVIAKLLDKLDDPQFTDMIRANPKPEPEQQRKIDLRKDIEREVRVNMTLALQSFTNMTMGTAFAEAPRNFNGQAFYWIETNLENGRELTKQIWEASRVLQILADGRQNGMSLTQAAALAGDYVSRQAEKARPTGAQPAPATPA